MPRPGQAERPLEGLQQLQVDAGFFANLTRRHMNAVITDDATRRHQHRGELCPDLFDGKTLAQQPLDQFGPLLARYSVEAVEQPRRFDVDVASHSANVQRQNDQLVHAFDIATDLAAPPEVLWRHATGVDGVNNELIPLMRMTMPRGLREATLDQLPLGERAGRSWVLLFGAAVLFRHRHRQLRKDATCG